MAATVHRAKYTTAIQPTTCEWTSRSIAATTLGKTKSLSGTVCDNAVCNNDVVRVEFFRFIGTKKRRSDCDWFRDGLTLWRALPLSLEYAAVTAYR